MQPPPNVVLCGNEAHPWAGTAEESIDEDEEHGDGQRDRGPCRLKGAFPFTV